ncbi:MAG: recombinase family protein [Thermotogae bacterium]|nr:recombinase family protein [Thermotogota bacterium]MCL5033391.1 recombinase family protein [Thermotogota bacterium]
MKRAVAYARVSSNKQSETSIETQFDEIENFAEQSGIRIIEKFQDKITASGSKTRPEFEIMLSNALQGKYDMILVYKYDRFIRDDLEDQKLIRELEQKNVYVISCAERIDTTTPSGRLQRWLISGLNKFYLENLRDEIYTKTTKVAEKGYYLGGNVLYGYTLREIRDKEAARTRKVYEINEQEAIVVRKVFEMFANKESYNKIIAYLNDHFRNRTGQTWSKSTIINMLRNKKYVGIYTYREGNKHNPHANRQDKIEISGLIPAIVDSETFKKVQERLKPSNMRYRKSQALCRGLIYCGICGAKMTTRKSKGADQYVCSRFYAKRDTEYNGMSINKVDQFVLGYVRQMLANPDYEAIAKGYNEEASLRDEEYKQRIDALKIKQKELEDKIQNAVEAILNKSPLADVLQEKAAQLRRDLDQTKNDLSKVLNQGVSYVTIEMIKEKFEEYKHKLESDTEGQRELILSIVDKVIIHKRYIEIIAKNT